MSVKINGIEFENELFPNNERIFKSLPWQICAQNFIRVDFKDISQKSHQLKLMG